MAWMESLGMLHELGLSSFEEAVYLALLDCPRASPTDLAASCAATPSRIARALARLHELGLVAHLSGREACYTVIPPDLALDVLIRQREERLGQVRRTVVALTERFQTATRAETASELVEVVRGADAIHQRWLQLQQSARSEIRCLDKPPYIKPGNPAEPDLLRRGIRYRSVYDRTALDLPGKLDDIWEALDAGEDCRVAAGVPIKLFIADDRMAIAPLQHPRDIASAIVVHPSALLDALSALFESTWARAVLLRDLHAIASNGAPQLDTSQQRLLQLLATGFQDKAIARSLGISSRTVQRHIGELMTILGASSRFQLGLQAARLLREPPMPGNESASPTAPSSTARTTSVPS